MVLVALSVLWTGYLLVSWGRHTISNDGVSLADLAIPGHYTGATANATASATATAASPGVGNQPSTTRTPGGATGSIPGHPVVGGTG